MFENSELTVYKNAQGIPTALGYPIHSELLQNNKPLFGGGNKKNIKETGEIDYDNFAVPVGLACMTISIKANDIHNVDDDVESNVVPEGLYERLMELAETKPIKKMTKRNHPHIKKQKNKTHRKKK